MSEKKFYITTPLYYVNDVPHVGHAYSTIGADVLARFKRAQGHKVYLLTGTDEHGQKIAKAAAEKGYTSPKALADEVAPRFKELWKVLGITHDRFFRTTDSDHYAAAAEFFKRVRANGYLEKRSYEGWYSVQDETFWMESQLKQPGNLAPDSGHPCVKMSEENWFFLLSKFQEPLKVFLGKHPDFIQPELRRNEVLGSYLNAEGGVQDLSVTRSGVKWGIPVPGDESQVLYVWFDALINYLTATTWPKVEFSDWWPADVHIIGKDILRFHAVLWPGMLLAAGFKEEELPRQVFGTGFILNEGKKMSKSLGNSIDPQAWAAEYGPEVLRYYLLREVPFGQDGSISKETIEARYTTELANDFGNLLSRTLGMMEKYLGAIVPERPGTGYTNGDSLAVSIRKTGPLYVKYMEKLEFHHAIGVVQGMVREANQYVDAQAPWAKAKQGQTGRQELENCLYNLADAARVAALAFSPFMPKACDEALQRLGFGQEQFFEGDGSSKGVSLGELLQWGGLHPGQKVAKGEPLFPRRETVKA